MAISANLTYQYALQGGIKEIGLLATVCAAVGARTGGDLARSGPTPGPRWSAVGAAAALAIYNAVAVPFLGGAILLLGAGLDRDQTRAPERRWLGRRSPAALASRRCWPFPR